MAHTNRSIATGRRLLLFKWLMIFLPSGTVTLGHSLIQHTDAGEHTGSGAFDLPATLLVTFVGLALTYIFVETLFRVLGRLQADASSREQDVRTMSAVMQERERLSRELHDGVAQLVADLLLRLDTIRSLVEDNRRHEAEAELEHLHTVADEIYADIGESITGLRSNVTERGLIGALQDYVDRFEERHQIPTRLQILAEKTPGAAGRLSPPAALQVFKFVQEALTNVRKHAGAREVTVIVTSDNSRQLKVVIADDGHGFDPGAQGNGRARPLGLTSMRERVETLGGSFNVRSQPGAGTQVTAAIPLPRTKQENGPPAFAPPAG